MFLTVFDSVSSTFAGFVWRLGRKHSTATGGYFRCNRYEIVKKVEESHDQQKSEVC
jgi:hypothetical protein